MCCHTNRITSSLYIFNKTLDMGHHGSLGSFQAATDWCLHTAHLGGVSVHAELTCPIGPCSFCPYWHSPSYITFTFILKPYLNPSIITST